MTKQLTAALTLELLKGEAQELPAEFAIFSVGLVDTAKGVYRFSEASGQRCMEAAARYGNDYVIDYGHAAHTHPSMTLDPAESGKAAGWFRAEMREGALYATNIRWTPKARQMLMDREYRYFSPVFTYSEDGEVMSLLSVALTNLPATYGQQPLMASQLSPEKPRMKSLLAALGLAEDATEAAALEALEALKRTHATSSEMLSVLGQPGHVEALGTLKAWKAQTEQVVSLSQRIQELEGEKKKADLETVIGEAKRAGKVPPALEPELRKMELSQLKAFVAAMPVIAPVQSSEPHNAGSVVQLSSVEMQAASLAGMSVEQVAKRKALRAGVVSVQEKQTDTK